MSDGYKAGVIQDLHATFHDPFLLDLVLQALVDSKIDKLIINGDLLDFYSISAYGPKSPYVTERLEDEIYWCIEFFKKLRNLFPDIDIIFNAGNHEFRLDKYIWANCPAFMNFISLPKMIQVEHYNIQYNEYQEAYKMPDCDLRVVHSPPSYSMVSGAMTSLKKMVDGSFYYGCTHRLDSAYQTGVEGKMYRSYFGGWLGNIKEYTKWLAENENEMQSKMIKQVFSYMKGSANWQNAFSLIKVCNGFFHVEQIPIENSRFICGEHYYEL